MKIFYRISDNSYKKEKLLGATKEVCLDNFLKIFSGQDITVIADNCKPETIKFLEERHLNIIQTFLGNAGALRKALSLACELDDQEMVYIVEDDFLHIEHPIQFLQMITDEISCVQLIEEGLQVVNYLSLFDYRDKYENEYLFGETCKVFKTKHSHWRTTISSTMTFATRVKEIKEDKDIWWKYTKGDHPWDHHIFSEITEVKKLAVPIPGCSCHIDMTPSIQKRKVLIEEWAIEMMINLFQEKIVNSNHDMAYFKHVKSLPRSIQKLAMLSVIDAC